MPATTAATSGKDPKGLYSTLGIGPRADENEIRRAYRRLALRWHPDKNRDDPSATEQFQRISSAYEVLSDPQKRDMYDTTGCIDEEELMEGEGFSPADLFASFFNMHEELDEDEQAMMDEFLRLAGSSAFKRGRGSGRRRGKKARGGRGTGRRAGSGARAFEEEMLSEAFMAAMMGGAMGTEAAPVCPQGHKIKRRKDEASTYECDVCGKDIVAGKRFFDCRKCDWSICQRCHKEAAAALDEDEDEAELLDQHEILEAFCEMHTSVVREGRRLQHKCDICNATLASEDKVLPHMEDKHIDVIEAFMEEAMIAGAGAGDCGFPGMGFGAGIDPDEMHREIMGMIGSGMIPGMPGAPTQGYPGSSGPSRQAGSRRKKKG